MPLKDWFAARRRSAAQKELEPAERDKRCEAKMKQHWATCVQCKAKVLLKTFHENLHVCPECDYHHRIGARTRLAILCDHFEEMDADLAPADPLVFSDTEPYQERQIAARDKARLNDAVVTGIAHIGSETAAIAVMDFAYMGGSMGSVVGEKITRLVERALAEQLPVIVITASGGARMQEGIFSLMQMVKTSAALARLHEAGLFYLTILTEPTFGGVTASYGTLGDVIIAEEGARIGFAGRRVIEQTIRQKLPADFQTAGYLMKYGQVDQVVSRAAMKPMVETLLRLHRSASGKQPAPSPDWCDRRTLPVMHWQQQALEAPPAVPVLELA